MRATLRILFLIPAGFVLACYAGAFALLWPFLHLPPGALGDPLTAIELAFGFTAQAAQIGAAAFLPWILFVAAAETLRWRSLLLHLGLGVLAGFSASRLGAMPASVETATVTAGLAFALVYWLVAGHGAGRPRRPAAASLPSPSPIQE